MALIASPMGTPPVHIAVLIATRDRPELLASRAIPSVVAQTRRPDLLVVVDDSNASPVQERDRRNVESSSLSGAFLLNMRTDGAAGAWNTGLDHILRRTSEPATWYVAVLDDDDWWEPNHLEVCATVARGGADMVVSGLVRHEGQEPGVKLSIPDALVVDDFLGGNPHVQGSNLFVKLDVLLEAGGFDEALSSCTDRDLCIRIMDLGDVTVASTGAHTVHHHADGDRQRLSTPGSKAKREGLTAFWTKWRSRMTEDVRQRFVERASSRFGWERPTAPPTRASLPLLNNDDTEPLDLIVGMIADSSRLVGIEALLGDLHELARRPDFKAFEVVLLENGERRAAAARWIHQLAEEHRRRGLRVYVYDIERQGQDSQRGLFGPPHARGEGRVGIGAARTMLQTYVGLRGSERRDVIAWIVDDDMRLDNLVYREGASRLERVPVDLFGHVRRLRKLGVAAVLGPYTDAPPVPFASTIRTQVVDLLHNLHWLARLDPAQALPSRLDENRAAMELRRDFYYDLSRLETDRLETPFWLLPAGEGETVKDAFVRLSESVVRVLAGEAIFRPLFLEWPRGLEAASEPSVIRGGNTFVFDLRALREVPNTVPRIEGREPRRSDMIWAVLNQFAYDRRIVSAPLPLRQDRRDAHVEGLDAERLVADMQGYALFSALIDLLRLRREERREGRDDLRFSEDDLALIEKRFTKYLTERVAAFELSAHRIRGAARAIEALLTEHSTATWWWREPATRLAVRQIQQFSERLRQEFAPEAVAKIPERARRLAASEARAFVADLADNLARYREATARQPITAVELEDQREEIALRTIERLCRTAGPLRRLGAGAEGVVVTDDVHVYKSIDAWKVADVAGHVSFLRGLMGRWGGSGVLCPILDVATEGVHTVLTLPFEESEPYRGGHGPDLVRLLRQCRECGITCRNVHPDNLRVTAHGLRLIDYGSDIRPFDETDFLHMCRRAWLTWRWHHRPDLKQLMRRALRDDSLPELDGFERFLRAVEIAPRHEVLDDLLMAKIAALRPRHVLDHGCGKAKLARRLSATRVDVVGFDPDVTLAARWSADAPAPGLTLTNDPRALEAHLFDLVVSELVLCAIEDEAEYTRTLSELRRLVKEDGRVLVAVCNPYFTFGRDTPLQTRRVPPTRRQDETFVFEKVPAHGQPRRDVHRPFARLRRDLLRAGLAIETTFETATVDVERFEPASDHLVLLLRPAPVGPRVSLMIKTCVMEWRTIERQVEHLVQQLEGPRAFAERVLVVDSRVAGFTRAYDEPNVVEHGRAVDRLLRRGLIDRVVHGPAARDEVLATSRAWFGVDSYETHAENGGQVTSTLVGLEACTGEFMLSVDSDVLVSRGASEHDYLGDMLKVFEAQASALTVSMNIPYPDDRPYAAVGPSGPWRVEVRAALFHRARLLASRPLPNRIVNGRLALSWHRALDEAVRSGAGTSWRGGDRRTCFVHVPNERKHSREGWLTIMDRMERGWVPAEQVGHVDLRGELEDWLGPKRSEPFVFVVTGRNVPQGRLRRCIDSMLAQGVANWGAVLIDDASDREPPDSFDVAVRRYSSRTTIIRTHQRRGQLANMVWAIRHVCSDPESVIVTLDADDALIGPSVLARLKAEYERGADVTVGAMLRTDKHARYPVTLSNPRANRGGNVWQHLRSFRKRLFDAIPDEELQLDGSFVDLANDWAYMLPIVELATKPVAIEDPLYLHEPSGVGKRNDRDMREAVIARLLERSRLVVGSTE